MLRRGLLEVQYDTLLKTSLLSAVNICWSALGNRSSAGMRIKYHPRLIKAQVGEDLRCDVGFSLSLRKFTDKNRKKVLMIHVTIIVFHI